MFRGYTYPNIGFIFLIPHPYQINKKIYIAAIFLQIWDLMLA